MDLQLEVRDTRFHDIVDDKPLEVVATGFVFLEGPVWRPTDHAIIMSDIPASRMYIVHGTESTVYRDPSHKANGNAWDRSGRLVTCEHASSRVTREELDGTTTVLADRFEAEELNSPNDIVVALDGTTYFTDPPFGRMEYFGILRDRELDFCGVYELPADGSELRLVAKDFALPNGLCLSVDEQALFVNDTEHGHIRRFTRTADGLVEDPAVWATLTGNGSGRPDGMKIDRDGNVYCTGPGGIHVLSPQAESLGVIPIPEATANFAFGGEDLCTLYTCSSTTLFSLRVRVPGIDTIWPIGA
jgi:gluconolactonase